MYNRVVTFAKALCDLRASINLKPLSIYKKLGLGYPKPSAAATDGRSNGEEAYWDTL